LLLSFLFSVVSGKGGTTAEDCTIGEQWTKNFIRFECFKGTGKVVKGVRPIGCVPTNTDGGAMIAPGATFDEKYFTYSCSKSREGVAYEIKNCRDEAGVMLPVGEKRKRSDGVTFNCYTENTGAVKLSQAGGCEYKGKVYTMGQVYIQDVELK
ncbi:hypothetical protein PMAYCL1PPCAC_25949, partial [Pristionchus mayeri]